MSLLSKCSRSASHTCRESSARNGHCGAGFHVSPGRRFKPTNRRLLLSGTLPASIPSIYQTLIVGISSFSRHEVRTRAQVDELHLIESTWDDNGVFAGTRKRWSTHVGVTRRDEYDIVVESGIVDHWVENSYAIQPGRPSAWVITDETVWNLHGHRLMRAQGAEDALKGVFQLSPGESSKSLDRWREVLEWMRVNRVRRRDVLVAFGGSMVSDVTGFVAATYMRGVPYINVPTSLLAQVDGGMGGKVAVNTPAAKNLVGAFHHPCAVLADPNLLTTLPVAEIASGLSEAIKTAIVASPRAFDFIASRIKACLAGEVADLAAVVRICASIKMHLLDPDPYEVDLRRVLNFGHTVGHAIETATDYVGIRHGEAVAIGMAVASRLGQERGLTSSTVREEITDALLTAQLPAWGRPATAQAVVECLQMIKAIRDGSLRFVVPLEIGRMAILEDVSGEEIMPLIEPPGPASTARPLSHEPATTGGL